MNTVGVQHNADFGSRYQDRACPAVTRTATDEQLDSAILAVLADVGGGPIAWSEVREQLPRTRYWRPIEALVRLHQSGRVHAVKVGGQTIVASAA